MAWLWGIFGGKPMWKLGALFVPLIVLLGFGNGVCAHYVRIPRLDGFKLGGFKPLVHPHMHAWNISVQDSMYEHLLGLEEQVNVMRDLEDAPKLYELYRGAKHRCVLYNSNTPPPPLGHGSDRCVPYRFVPTDRI